jgi:hypothetical protein
MLRTGTSRPPADTAAPAVPVLVAALVVVAAALAGCGGQGVDGGGPGPERSPGEARVRPAWTSCDADGPGPVATPGAAALDAGYDALTLPRLGDDFAAVAAVLCGNHPARRPDGGDDLVASERRATDVAALVAALRLPDEPPTNGACTLDLPAVPWLVLLDARGRWVRPGVPQDACGKPRVEVRRAVEELRLIPVSSRPIREIESAGAAAAGCSERWADMIWVETTMGRREWSAVAGPLLGGASPVRLCAYRVPASEQRSGKPGGEFAYGGPLTADRWAAVERGVLAAAPAAPCAEPASRFALLRAETGGEVYVEQDGCRRILVSPGSGRPALRQADATLLALLAER